MNENPLLSVLTDLGIIAFAVSLYALFFRSTSSSDEVRYLPRKTRNMKKLRPGTEFIVIDLEEELPIVQRIHDYQDSFGKRIPKNMFYLSGCGKNYLKKFKTYIIEKHESNRSTFLRPTTRMITRDIIFG